MRSLRLVIELILLTLAGFFLFLGLSSQKALGIGLMLLTVAVVLFIFELFLYHRFRLSLFVFNPFLENYIKQKLGFDYHKNELLEAANLTEEDVSYIKEWFGAHTNEVEAQSKFWRKEFLDRISPIGMDWASGYTPFLDKFSREREAEPLSFDEHVFLAGYKKEIESAERVLAQSGRNNVLLVGEEGVGKHFVLKELERLIESGRALPALAFKRFIWLNTEAVLSGITNPGELRARLDALFSEAMYAGNIVLGLERIHDFFDPAFPELPDVFLPFLASEYSQVVATTTPHFLSSRLNAHYDVVSQFAKITVEEPGLKQTMLTLLEAANSLEGSERIAVPYAALKKLVELADRFSQDAPRPQKDLDLLSEAVSFIKSKGKSSLEVPDVLEIISARTGIPLGAIGEEEKEKLLNLEEVLHKKLINQREAVSVISQALKRARIEVRSPKRPIGSFLFLGPTGVGKTTAAKALASLYFGREEAMIRFDMSEFQKLEDIDRLIENVSREVKQTPYTLLLLDEVEKAHSKILNLFLQVLDEGMMTDIKGLKVDFRNLIIIATSNAGSEFIREEVSRVGTQEFERDLLDLLQKQNIFSPEFLNRFDAVVTFTPLGKEELKQIAGLLLEDLAERLKKEHNLTFIVSDELKSFLAEKGFDPQYGARPMRRVLQNTIETLIADKLLKDEIKKGDRVEITSTDLDSKE
ncbi:MAG: ATP-dependent Clp protease ATP-binding subunit [Candidatus Portnoybacteria bacterium]|nr:ATP-dependent Clp protease ATP-binding subunit [Candidatus Portnoybacteria bacterium]